METAVEDSLTFGCHLGAEKCGYIRFNSDVVFGSFFIVGFYEEEKKSKP